MKLCVITFFSIIYTICVVPNYGEVLPVEADSAPIASTPVKYGSTTEKPSLQHLEFLQAFLGSFAMIVVSELGDKTFFIAAIMAMRHPRIMVFLGAIVALAFMTILSVVFGWAITIIPKKVTYYASTILFLIFGIKMIRDGIKMSPSESQEEYEEVQADLRRKEEEFEKETLTKDVESGYINRNSKVKIFKVLSHIIVQAFTLTFLAEWGDRSQISTIILAARDNVYGVALGAIAGHSICTGLAVIGGRFIAQKISVKTVTIVGGFVFIIFAVVTIYLEH